MGCSAADDADDTFNCDCDDDRNVFVGWAPLGGGCTNSDGNDGDDNEE